jgi:exonuclease III
MFRGRPRQIDHVLVSEALWGRFRGARLLNETLREDNASPGAEGVGVLASDHAPLRAEFE